MKNPDSRRLFNLVSVNKWIIDARARIYTSFTNRWALNDRHLNSKYDAEIDLGLPVSPFQQCVHSVTRVYDYEFAHF